MKTELVSLYANHIEILKAEIETLKGRFERTAGKSEYTRTVTALAKNIEELKIDNEVLRNINRTMEDTLKTKAEEEANTPPPTTKEEAKKVCCPHCSSDSLSVYLTTEYNHLVDHINGKAELGWDFSDAFDELFCDECGDEVDADELTDKDGNAVKHASWFHYEN